MVGHATGGRPRVFPTSIRPTGSARQPALWTARSEPVAGPFALETVDHTSAWGRLPNRRVFCGLAAPALDCWLVCAILADKLDPSINKKKGGAMTTAMVKQE